MQKKHRGWIGRSVLTLSLLASPAGLETVRAAEAAAWTDTAIDRDGWLLAAHGTDRDGLPIQAVFGRSATDGLVNLTTLYLRGSESLSVSKVYDANGGVTLSYVSGTEGLRVTVTPAPAPGGRMVQYEILRGPVFTLTATGEGGLAPRDVTALRGLASEGSPFFALLRRYHADLDGLRAYGSVGGDSLTDFWRDTRAGSPELAVGGCWDECAAECDLQCAFECNIDPSGVSCGICKSACALGCAIGCGFRARK